MLESVALETIRNNCIELLILSFSKKLNETSVKVLKIAPTQKLHNIRSWRPETLTLGKAIGGSKFLDNRLFKAQTAFGLEKKKQFYEPLSIW